jgi:protein-disulfide isomerase
MRYTAPNRSHIIGVAIILGPKPPLAVIRSGRTWSTQPAIYPRVTVILSIGSVGQLRSRRGVTSYPSILVIATRALAVSRLRTTSSMAAFWASLNAAALDAWGADIWGTSSGTASVAKANAGIRPSEPDLVVKAAQEMRRRQEAESAVKTQAAVTANRDQLLGDPTVPVEGNPNGDVTVVEFFDYQCGYCKMAQEAVSKLLATDKNVRMIYKEYPILGPDSVQGSKAALASVNQGKYTKFHDTLMNTKGHLSNEIIFTLAKESGLDVEKLKEDMGDDSIVENYACQHCSRRRNWCARYARFRNR